MKTASTIFLILVSLTSCRNSALEKTASMQAPNSTTNEAGISKDTAILIAKGDSCGNYAFEKYDVHVYDEPNAWHLVFELKDPGVHGGGPDYLIDKANGKILRVTYYK